MRLSIFVLLAVLLTTGCTRGTSLTMEQDEFMQAVWTFEDVLANTRSASQVNAVDEAHAADWLLVSMRRSAFTPERQRAITDLFRGRSEVNLRATADDSEFRRRAGGDLTPKDAKEFRVSFTDSSGKRTEWLINGWGWTFLNGGAREWLVQNKWTFVCEKLGKAGTSGKVELLRLQGEVCRQALDGHVQR